MNELTCRDVVACLADYLTGELATRRREQFERHLEACDDCLAYLRQYANTVRLAAAAFDRVDDPDDREFRRALVQAILAARR